MPACAVPLYDTRVSFVRRYFGQSERGFSSAQTLSGNWTAISSADRPSAFGSLPVIHPCRNRSAACAQMHTPKQFRHARAPEHRKRPQATDLQPSPIPATASSARLRTIRHRRNRRRAFPAPVTGCVPDGPRRLLFIAQESERKCIKMTR